MNEQRRNDLVKIITSLEQGMNGNTEGLKRKRANAQRKCNATALAALQRMDASDREIDFRSVAADLATSTA
jgi:hypothetical protein